MTTTRPEFDTSHIEGKTIYVLAIVSIVQFIFPITESDQLILNMIASAFYASLIIIGIILVRNNRRLVRLFSVFGLIWFLAGVLYALNPTATWVNLSTYIVYIVFDVTITAILLRYIFLTRHITRDVLYAAISVYLLLGAIFVPVYGIIETLTFAFSNGTVNAFSGGVAAEGFTFLWQDFIYYSYVTLTTLGYGDILPVTMLAKAAVSIEAIIGVMYLTIIMARLVSLYSADIHTITSENT